METVSLWKLFGTVAAIFCVLAAFRRKRQPTGDKTVVIQRSSLAGRIGSFLMGHTILSVLSGMIGFNIVIAVGSVLLAIPLWIMGAEVRLPRFTISWVNNMISRTKEAFSEKKEAVVEKIHDGKEAVAEKARDVKAAVVEKITGKKDESADANPAEEIVDLSPDSDEYWGGPPSPHAPPEEISDERLAFDTLPPDKKIAIFASARPIEGAVPAGIPDIYAPFQWYRLRSGRSTYSLTTPERIELFTLMWTADRDHTHGMDAKTRVHFTRISTPASSGDFKDCYAGFGKLPAAERFAAFSAAWKMSWPLPESVPLAEGRSREEQYYQIRICPNWHILLTRDEWVKAKDAAFEEARAAEIAAAEPRTAKLMREAREKAAGIAHGLKSKATSKATDVKHKAADRAKDIASDVKHKSGQVARDLKGKAEEGVKDGAKGLFWKALGY